MGEIENRNHEAQRIVDAGAGITPFARQEMDRLQAALTAAREEAAQATRERDEARDRTKDAVREWHHVEGLLSLDQDRLERAVKEVTAALARAEAAERDAYDTRIIGNEKANELSKLAHTAIAERDAARRDAEEARGLLTTAESLVSEIQWCDSINYGNTAACPSCHNGRGQGHLKDGCELADFLAAASAHLARGAGGEGAPWHHAADGTPRHPCTECSEESCGAPPYPPVPDSPSPAAACERCKGQTYVLEYGGIQAGAPCQVVKPCPDCAGTGQAAPRTEGRRD